MELGRTFRSCIQISMFTYCLALVSEHAEPSQDTCGKSKEINKSINQGVFKPGPMDLYQLFSCGAKDRVSNIEQTKKSQQYPTLKDILKDMGK